MEAIGNATAGQLERTPFGSHALEIMSPVQSSDLRDVPILGELDNAMEMEAKLNVVVPSDRVAGRAVLKRETMVDARDSSARTPSSCGSILDSTSSF